MLTHCVSYSSEKNMLKVCTLITLLCALIALDYLIMVLFDGLTTHLNILLQKGIRYKNHHRNYESLGSVLIPSRLLLHESREVIAKIKLDITSELANLKIDDTTQKRRELYTKYKSYEKVLERRRTNKWRKVKNQEKQKIMPETFIQRKHDI